MNKFGTFSAALAIAFGAFASSASATSYVDGNWGALAFNPNTEAYGWSAGYPSDWEAEDRALDECGRRCDIVAVYIDECAAIVLGDYDHYVEYGSSKRNAERAALRQCDRSEDYCEPLVSSCSD